MSKRTQDYDDWYREQLRKPKHVVAYLKAFIEGYETGEDNFDVLVQALWRIVMDADDKEYTPEDIAKFQAQSKTAEGKAMLALDRSLYASGEGKGNDTE